MNPRQGYPEDNRFFVVKDEHGNILDIVPNPRDISFTARQLINLPGIALLSELDPACENVPGQKYSYCFFVEAEKTDHIFRFSKHEPDTDMWTLEVDGKSCDAQLIPIKGNYDGTVFLYAGEHKQGGIVWKGLLNFSVHFYYKPKMLNP